MSTRSVSSQITILNLLGLLFVGLKLGHVIDWDWWQVLLPFEIPIGAGLIGVLIVIGVWVYQDIKGKR